ncbi:MAG: YcxB family protein [Planctomycetaceae bacterium]
MDTITASFTYEPGEFARGLRRVLARRHRARFDSLIAALFVVFGGYLSATHGFSLLAALLCGVGAAFGGLLAYGVLIVPVLVERSHSKLREPYTLTFSRDDIHFQTPTIDSRLEWSLYHSWAEDDEFLYLFHGKREVSIVPWRGFAIDADRTALRELVAARVDAGNAD